MHAGTRLERDRIGADARQVLVEDPLARRQVEYIQVGGPGDRGRGTVVDDLDDIACGRGVHLAVVRCDPDRADDLPADRQRPEVVTRRIDRQQVADVVTHVHPRAVPRQRRSGRGPAHERTMTDLRHVPQRAVRHQLQSIERTEGREAVARPVLRIRRGRADPQPTRCRIDREVVAHFGAIAEQDIDELADGVAAQVGEPLELRLRTGFDRGRNRRGRAGRCRLAGELERRR